MSDFVRESALYLECKYLPNEIRLKMKHMNEVNLDKDTDRRVAERTYHTIPCIPYVTNNIGSMAHVCCI